MGGWIRGREDKGCHLRRIATILVAFLMLFILQRGSAAAGLVTDVVIRIHCRTTSNDPIEGLVIAVRGGTSAENIRFARTDESGDASITLSLIESDDVFAVMHGVETAGLMPGVTDRASVVNRNKQVLASYWFERSFEGAVVAGQSEYVVNLVGYPVIRMLGRLIDRAGEGIEGTVWLKDNGSRVESTRNGLFQVAAPRAKQPVELFARIGKRVIAKLVPELPGDADIGEIREPDDVCDMKLRIVPTATEKWSKRPEPHVSGVTLVSSDGERIFSFVRLGTTEEVLDRSSADQVPRVPAGTYFVAPGWFMATKAQLRLIDAVRARVDVAALGIPQVVAGPGEPDVVKVDAEKTEAAILALPK